MKNLLNKYNKKAMTDELEWTMVKLFLLSLIILIVFTSIMKIQDNSIHVLNSKSRDLALTYSASALAEGNLYLKYNLPKNLTASITGDCKITLEDQIKRIPSIYFCNGIKNDLTFNKEAEGFYSLTKIKKSEQ